MNLSTDAITILTAFGQVDYDLQMTTEDIANSLHIKFHQAQHEVDQLMKYGLLDGYSTKYWLTPDGRDFLAKYKLL